MGSGTAIGALRGTPRGGAGNGVYMRSHFNETYARGNGLTTFTVAGLASSNPPFYNRGALPGYTTRLAGGLECLALSAPRRPSVGLGGVGLLITGFNAPGQTIKRGRKVGTVMGVDVLIETIWTFSVSPGALATNSAPFTVVYAPTQSWQNTPGVAVGMEYWAGTFRFPGGCTTWIGLNFATTIISGPAVFAVATCSFTNTSRSVTTTVVAGFSKVKVNYGVVGAGIPAGAYVTAKTSTTHITISATSTSAETAISLTFTPTLGATSRAVGVIVSPQFTTVPAILNQLSLSSVLPNGGHMTTFNLVTTGCSTTGATVGTATAAQFTYQTTTNYLHKWGIKCRYSNFFARSSIFGATWPATNTTPPKCAVTIRGNGTFGALAFRKVGTPPAAPPTGGAAMFAWHGSVSGHTFIAVRSHSGTYSWWNLNTHTLGHGAALPT